MVPREGERVGSGRQRLVGAVVGTRLATIVPEGLRCARYQLGRLLRRPGGR